MKTHTSSSLSSREEQTEKAIELTSLIGDFLIDPQHSDMYQKLKSQGSKEDIRMISELRKGQKNIRQTTEQNIEKNFQDIHPESDEDIEFLINTDIKNKEIADIRRLYADPEIRKIYFEEYAKRKEYFDMLKRGYMQLPKVQNIDNIITKAKDKILDIRIAAFAKNRQLSPNEIAYIKKIQKAILQKDEEKTVLLQKREIATAYRHQQLKTYKHQLDTEGFMITPSRQKIIDEIIEKVLLGQNVLLTGPTGTGKTVLAIQAVKTIATKLHIGLETVQGKSLAQELQNNPNVYQLLDEFVVVLSGHAGITPSEFIAKMGLKGDEKGGTQTYTQLGKVLKAFVDGNIPIIDEIDLIPNDVLMRIKHLFTLKSGKTYSPQEDGNQKYTLLTTTVIATANIKSAKHQDRQEMDPAIVRLLPGTEVGYLPEEETYDLALANIIEPNGFVYGIGKENISDQNGVLYLLIRALKDIEDNYLGKGEGITLSNKSNMYLQKAILELGSFVALFKGYKESGKDFAEFIKNKIVKFVSNGAYPKTDRLLLINIFATKGLITKQEIPILLTRMSDVSETELDQNIFKDSYEFTPETLRFIDPYELANCDLYHIRNLETLELDDKKIVIREKIKQLSVYILTLENDHAENISDVIDTILDEYEQDANYEISTEEIHQILGGLYELGLPEKILECSSLGDYRKEKIQLLQIFDVKDTQGKKIFKNILPKREEIQPNEQPKQTKEKLSSLLPDAVKKQEQEAMKYFTANKEINHIDIISQVQERRKQGMITYKNTGGNNYEVNFRFPGSPMTRYMPADKHLNDTTSNYTNRDGTNLISPETTRGKLQNEEGKKHLKEKESKEKKVLPSKEDFLKLGKLLCPKGSEEEQILAFMMATGFYGWMRLSDTGSNYQLAVLCSRGSGFRRFNEMGFGDLRCSCIYTAVL